MRGGHRTEPTHVWCQSGCLWCMELRAFLIVCVVSLVLETTRGEDRRVGAQVHRRMADLQDDAIGRSMTSQTTDEALGNV